jgi:tRNA (guanine37-N1)-methyltransferase
VKIGVVTLFPEMLEAVTRYGISGRAVAAGVLDVRCYDPRAWTEDRHRTVDDKPYGGGPGMVMKVEPVRAAIDAARAELPQARVAYLTPQGRRLDQASVVELAVRPELILLAGRYEGIDERVIARDVDEEWSIGDYVLSGGELAAMVIIDSVCRLLPEALGDPESAEAESFVAGLLDHPHYTRPEVVGDQRVPDVLLSGNHEAIRRWRRQQALGRTHTRRPDLLEGQELDAEARSLLDAFLTGRD